jgi:hypothetical protein
LLSTVFLNIIISRTSTDFQSFHAVSLPFCIPLPLPSTLARLDSCAAFTEVENRHAEIKPLLTESSPFG